MKRSKQVLVAVAFSIFTLTGCGVNGSLPPSAVGGGSDIASIDPAIKDSGIDSPSVTPAIIRTGDMTLQTGDVEKVFSEVKSAVSKFEGRVESSNYQGRIDGYGPNAYLTIRVPESKLDAAVEELSKLAKRTSLTTSTSDVTLQTVDLQGKVDALEESRTRLQNLLDKSTSTAELIAGEQAMATLRTELDGYKSQLDYLKNQVAESTLNVQIVDDNSSVTSGLRSFKEIFLQSIRGFLNAFQSAFVFIFTAVPWVLILGGGYLLVRLILSVIRRFVDRKSGNE